MRFTNFYNGSLYEAPMNPSSFAQAIKQGGEKQVLVGFEFEVCIPSDSIANYNNQNQEATPRLSLDDMTVEQFVKRLTTFYGNPDANYGDTVDQWIVGKRPYRGTRKRLPYNAFKILRDEQQTNKALDDCLRANARMMRVPLARLKLVFYTKMKELTNFDLRDPEQLSAVNGRTGMDQHLRNTWYRLDRSHETSADPDMQLFNSLIQNMMSTRHLRHGSYTPTQVRQSYYGAAARQFDLTVGQPGLQAFSDWVKSIHGTDNMGQLLSDNGPWEMTNKFREYESEFLTPGVTYHNADRGRGGYAVGSKFAKEVLEPVFGQIEVFRSYHQATKRLDRWYVEPDGSLQPNSGDSAVEIVGPPLSPVAAMDALDKFYNLARSHNFYTSKQNNTGLHINVSIPDKLDVLKLAVFLGDQYVLQAFGRENNRYANSVLRDLKNNIRDNSTLTDIAGSKDMIKRFGEIAKNLSESHFASINFNGKYVSFRHAGGDYLGEYQKIVQTVGRFVRAMLIAADPTVYRNEYMQKLIRLAPEALTTDPIQRSADFKKSGIKYLGIYIAPMSYNLTDADGAEIEQNQYVSPDELKRLAIEKLIRVGYYFMPSSAVMVPVGKQATEKILARGGLLPDTVENLNHTTESYILLVAIDDSDRRQRDTYQRIYDDSNRKIVGLFLNNNAGADWKVGLALPYQADVAMPNNRYFSVFYRQFLKGSNRSATSKPRLPEHAL